MGGSMVVTAFNWKGSLLMVPSNPTRPASDEVRRRRGKTNWFREFHQNTKGKEQRRRGGRESFPLSDRPGPRLDVLKDSTSTNAKKRGFLCPLGR